MFNIFGLPVLIWFGLCIVFGVIILLTKAAFAGLCDMFKSGGKNE